MEALFATNASFASEIFAAAPVPKTSATVGDDAFPTAYALRLATLRRSRYPATAPPPVAVAGSTNAPGSGASSGQLILHSSATSSSSGGGAGGALIVAAASTGNGGAAANATSSAAAGISTEYVKRARDGGDETAIIAVDAEVLRNKTRTRDEAIGEKEKLHARWKLQRVVAGHSGAVMSVAVDPTNTWFATGSDDATIRVYALATGKLKIQPLTGHSSAVRALCVSKRNAHMYSGSNDNSVRVWDLETNKTIGTFFGHKGAVTGVAVSDELDVVATASYDRMVRVFDVRTREAVHTFRGHEKGVLCVAVQNCEPQVISGGEDTFVYLWDIRAGKALTRLTRHKKPVHSITIHHTEATMVTVGDDNVRKWRLPTGEFFTNMTSSAIPNAPEAATWRTSCLNADDVLFVGARNGQMRFYDWGSHRLYQHAETTSVKGTLPGEHGICCATFDGSGTRLLTGEGDKTVKMWHQLAPPQ